MLEIQNVSKTFNAGTVNEKTALNGLNLKLNEGDFVTVIGGNGAGKSTVLGIAARLLAAEHGCSGGRHGAAHAEFPVCLGLGVKPVVRAQLQ